MALSGAYKIPRPRLFVLSATKIKSGWLKVDRKSKKYQNLHWLYEGQLSNGRAHGFGVLTKVYKDFCTMRKFYAGSWVNGKKQGTGSLWLDNGSYYEGEFCQNKRHGFGRLWHCNGCFYQGTWKNDLYDGNGMLVQANGNRYEGQFSGGKKEGFGMFYHLKTGQIQQGQWLQDVCKSAIITDMEWRQSAHHPTPYPIPKLAEYYPCNEIS